VSFFRKIEKEYVELYPEMKVESYENSFGWDQIQMAEWLGKDTIKIAQCTEENEKRLIEYLKQKHGPIHRVILFMETGTKLKHFVAVFSLEEDGFFVIDSNFGFELKFVLFSRVHEIVTLNSFFGTIS